MSVHDINKERLELALEAAGLDLWENDLVTGDVTRKAIKTFAELGYSEEEALSYIDDLFTIIHPDDIPVVKAAVDGHLAGVTPQYRCEFRIRAKRGAWVWYANYGKIMDLDGDNQGQRFIGVTFNIDDRKRKEDELESINRKLAEQNALLENMNALLRHNEEVLRENEELLRETQTIAGLGTYVLDIPSGRWKSSDVLDKLLGISEAYERSIESWIALVHPDDCAMMVDYFRNEVIGQGKAFDKEYRIIRHDDQTERWLHGLGKLDFDAQGRPLKMLGTIQDITKRKQYEADLRIAATAFESQEGMIITDENNVIRRINQAFSTITGYNAEDVIGKNTRIFKSDRHDENFYAALGKTLNTTGAWGGEIWGRRKNGEIYPGYLTITAVKNTDGIVSSYVATLADITASKLAAEEIQHLAFYDHLTNLPNRRLLLDRLQQAIASSGRSGKEGALLFIDLDNFKSLNDTLGHDKGDLLLQQVAQRLVSCVREGDTVARLGGDEFVVMLEDLSEHTLEAAEQTEEVGQKILAALNRSYQLATHEYHNTPSIGITTFKGHQKSVDELIKQADIAMYQAKKAGRNALQFFDPQMQETINTRVELEGKLRSAHESQQFQVYYQIQVDSASRPLGAEVLIRWLHPQRGVVSPEEFIHLAEETGLILPIGRWVMEMACARLKAWQQDRLTSDLVLSVNVSAKQFHQIDFVAQVESLVQDYAINPKLLKLELTESMLLENIEETIATMNALKAIGVQFSLDDFGTGYSSIQYLKRLPLDQIKIDRSFVRDLAVDSSDKAIVSTIIAMAQSLNLEVIAEGVEIEEQRQFLLNSGCTHFQGFLFSKPVPIEQFEVLLKQQYLSGKLVPIKQSEALLTQG
ncbi:MAG: EAL domain-containing protein [Gammaproteobacteria bacterium]